MERERVNLGERSDLSVVTELVSLDGQQLVDVGCGPGLLSRSLAELGANVIGIEPDPIQAEKNRAAEPTQGVTFVEHRAEHLPLERNSVDGVFFFRSLHHVPAGQMDKALTEAIRVLRPQSGFLYVVEPDVAGSHHQVIRHFHDEAEVRSQAQAALTRLPSEAFGEVARYRYEVSVRYPNFEAMAARFTGMTFNNIDSEKIDTADVRAIFQANRTAEGDYSFVQPMLLDLYRAPQS